MNYAQSVLPNNKEEEEIVYDTELVLANLDREDILVLLKDYYPLSENTISQNLRQMGNYNHDTGDWRWMPPPEISNIELYEWYLNFKKNNPFR